MAASKLSEKAGVLHITIEQGTTFNPVMTWKDQVGTPINLTGYSARMQMRADIDSAVIIHESTTENFGITLGGTAGTITFNIDAATTAAFDFNTAVYDLELVNGPIVNRLLRGDVILSKEVTR